MLEFAGRGAVVRVKPEDVLAVKQDGVGTKIYMRGMGWKWVEGQSRKILTQIQAALMEKA